VFFFSDELIRSIQMDWDQGEDYIQLSMALTEGIQFQDGPIRPKDSGVLDERNLTDVTPSEEDWQQLLELHATREFNKLRNSLISRYLGMCWPMTRIDLYAELDIAIVKALPRFRGAQYWDARTKSLKPVRLTTFVHRVMHNRLIDLARRDRDKPK